MKLLIASDIHGDIDSMNEVMRAYELHGAEKILLLGDLLYHGPRNDLPKGYNPKAVIEVLNKNSDKILTVRGN
jgi:predicted phosphodiesterase